MVLAQREIACLGGRRAGPFEAQGKRAPAPTGVAACIMPLTRVVSSLQV